MSARCRKTFFTFPAFCNIYFLSVPVVVHALFLLAALLLLDLFVVRECRLVGLYRSDSILLLDLFVVRECRLVGLYRSDSIPLLVLVVMHACPLLTDLPLKDLSVMHAYRCYLHFSSSRNSRLVFLLAALLLLDLFVVRVCRLVG